VAVRVLIALLCLSTAGCLDPSEGPPSQSAGTRTIPVRSTVELRLGRGHSRAGFTTRYPGGSFTIVMSAPRAARYHVVLEVAGIRADGFPRFRRDACTRKGLRLECRAGPFEAIPKGFGPWTVSVVKTSAPPARVRVRLRFAGRH
jgi:hypothetical protein